MSSILFFSVLMGNRTCSWSLVIALQLYSMNTKPPHGNRSRRGSFCCISDWNTHQVVLPALGCVFRIPLLFRRAHRRIHIGRVSIAVVSRVISPVPTSPSHSGELESKQVCLSTLTPGGGIKIDPQHFNNCSVNLGHWQREQTGKLDESQGVV